jgi:hypothetical protein
MLSSPGTLLFPKYLRHKSYVSLSNVFATNAFICRVFLVQIHLGHAIGIV